MKNTILYVDSYTNGENDQVTREKGNIKVKIINNCVNFELQL